MGQFPLIILIYLPLSIIKGCKGCMEKKNEHEWGKTEEGLISPQWVACQKKGEPLWQDEKMKGFWKNNEKEEWQGGKEGTGFLIINFPQCGTPWCGYSSLRVLWKCKDMNEGSGKAVIHGGGFGGSAFHLLIRGHLARQHSPEWVLSSCRGGQGKIRRGRRHQSNWFCREYKFSLKRVHDNSK